MSELDSQISPVATQTGNQSSSLGAGAQLRAAREAQGLHIGALAVALKVPVKKLEALEADRFDLLPGIVFSRALALSVCRSLRLDPQPILARLPQPDAVAAMPDLSGLNTRFKPSPMGGPLFSLPQFGNPAVWVALVLLLAIAAVYFWPSGAGQPEIGAQVAPLNGPDAAISPASIPAPSAVASAPLAMPSEAVALADSAALGAVPTPVSNASMSASGATLAPAESVVLTLKSRGRSWVEVTDAMGNMQLRKLTSEGETIQLSGPLPLSVVLGRADVVAVFVRGNPIDLASVSNNNVARFEVR